MTYDFLVDWGGNMVCVAIGIAYGTWDTRRKFRRQRKGLDHG